MSDPAANAPVAGGPADALQPWLEERFVWFHRHPELSHRETGTTARLAELLDNAGIEILDTGLDTGLVAIVRGGAVDSDAEPRPTVALRADIDALPVDEDTDLPYRSLTPGAMHACGHDFHMTTILGAALLLHGIADRLPGDVKIVFQPAEEVPQGGASEVVDTGALGDVQAIFGAHTTSLLPVGSLAIGAGPICAAVDQFTIDVRGTQTHGAHPDRGVDGILIAAATVQNLQSVVSRNLSPTHDGVVSVGRFVADGAWNVIPEQVTMEGTVRSFHAEDRPMMRRRVEQVAEGTAATFGGHASVTWSAGPPSVDNDPHWTELMRRTALEDGFTVVEPIATMGGEDFACYQQVIPGAFINVGTGVIEASNHSPRFRVDPAALAPTARYMAHVARAALAELAGASGAGH
ncbi:M20 metallopeptidase family protein [Bifidobacterium aerophilum]|uniref:Amidohydrolase n=1 Tax=Bifidobacterium aerophilum TaxID=1798155 RepID=A0A6N9Z2D3_9BIFI|nr:amidohydrolase [Bifidobacterium aerophilum]NEG88484.1 amidohydrolase [Bifidobacterium aerophilum]